MIRARPVVARAKGDGEKLEENPTGAVRPISREALDREVEQRVKELTQRLAVAERNLKVGGQMRV